jgi:hypothetical protein
MAMREHFTALTELLLKISNVYDQLHTENLWWRGQPAQGLKLIPRVYRKPGYKTAELELILNFERQAPLRYPVWPQDRTHQLFLMQHFGLPTRLLDWSMGVLTALYFAVSEDRQDKPASLWAINPIILNKTMTNNPEIAVFQYNEKEIKDLVDIAFMRKEDRQDLGDRVLATSGPESDLRMLMQWGVYTIHSTNKPIEDFPNYHDFASEICIPAKDRNTLRQALKIAGFSRSRLFPDLQSLAEDLRNIYKY